VSGDEDALHTQVNPSQGQIWKGNTPFLLAFIHMRFEQELLDTIALAKEPLAILAFVFKCDL
jgi:hypothetical protein